jgi:serine/threonine-protein kinase HipA
VRKVTVFVNGIEAGILEELIHDHYQFIYNAHYNGPPISLTMPIIKKIYEFEQFPSFFEGLLPEGVMLEGLLRQYKLDKQDLFGQLIQVGHDLVGAVTVESIP